MTVRMEGSYPRPGQKMDFKKNTLDFTNPSSSSSANCFRKSAICWKPALSGEEILGNLILIQKSIFCHWARTEFSEEKKKIAVRKNL